MPVSHGGVKSLENSDYVTVTGNDLTPNQNGSVSLVGSNNTVSDNL